MKINCENCGKEIERSKWKVERAKHSTCSKKCQGELIKKLNGTLGKCKFCKKTIPKGSTSEIFCDITCKQNHEKFSNVKVTDGFIDNKYTKLYFKIVKNRKDNPLDGYTENHHILPDSMGGSSDKSNMIRLSAREHFICHFLLTKMTVPYSVDWVKMQQAFGMMNASPSNKGIKRYMNSTLYETQRKNFSKAQSESQSGKKNSQYGTKWVNNSIINKKISGDDFEEFIVSGWIKGKIKTSKQEKWMYKEKETMKVRVCDIAIMNNHGWKLGLHPKRIKVIKEKAKKINKNTQLIDENYEALKSTFLKLDSMIKTLNTIFDDEQTSRNNSHYFSNKLKADGVKVKYITPLKDQKQTAIDYYNKFISGEYNSIRDFCRKEATISHVTMTKIWKKYIDGYESSQGKSLSSK